MRSGTYRGLIRINSLSMPLVEVLIPLFMNGHSLCLIIPNETHVGKTETCRNPKLSYEHPHPSQMKTLCDGFGHVLHVLNTHGRWYTITSNIALTIIFRLVPDFVILAHLKF